MEEKCPNCQQKAFVDGDCQACGFHIVSRKYQTNLTAILDLLKTACHHDKYPLSVFYVQVEFEIPCYDNLTGTLNLLQFIDAIHDFGLELENSQFAIAYKDPEINQTCVDYFGLDEIKILSEKPEIY